MARKSSKQSIENLIFQAKDSIKVLEYLQKEGLSKAVHFMQTQIPSRQEAQKMANDTLLGGLKKMGIATKSEVRDLEKKVEELASELRAQINKVSKKSSGTTGTKGSKNSADTETEASA